MPRRYPSAAQRHHDHAIEPNFVPEFLIQRQQHVIDDEKAVAGMTGDGRDVVRMQAQIQRVRYAARACDPEVRLEMRVMIPLQALPAGLALILALYILQAPAY